MRLPIGLSLEPTARWPRGLLSGMIGLLLLGAVALPAVAEDAPKPIKFGIFMSLTGGSAASASANRFGAEMAISEINAAGGIAHRPIVAVYGDDQADPTVGVGEIKRLLFQEKVDVVVGPTISQVTLATLPVLNDAKVASISDTGAPAITLQAGPYHFSIVPSVIGMGKQMADYAVDVMHAKTLAMLYDDGAAAKGMSESIRATLAARGLKLAVEQQYKFHPTDVTPQLLSVRRSNPDLVLVVSMSPDDGGIVQKNVLEIGWDVKELGSLAFTASGPLAVKVAGPDAFRNGLGQTYKRFTYCASTGKGDAVIVDFIKRATAYAASKNVTQTDYYNIAAGYDAVHVLKAAIEATGGTDGPTIASWIEAHAGEIPAISTERFAADKTSHFLIGPNALTMAERPDKRNADGLLLRAGGC